MMYKCIICDKDILSGDIFMKIEIDMRRLIYDKTGNEKDFIIPNGPVHSVVKFSVCDTCSNGIMTLAPKDIAMAIIDMEQ